MAGAKFEVCNSKNTHFGIMIPGFYLGFYLTYVVLSLKCQNRPKLSPPILISLLEKWLEPKFELCNSKNTDFGIMVLGFYLRFYLKFAVFDFQMSS